MIDPGLTQPELPPPALLLTTEELEALIPTLLYVEEWAEAVKAEIQAALEGGARMERAYLKPKIAFRKWDLREETIQLMLLDTLRAQGKQPTEDEVAPRKVLTPAAAEKLVGKKIFSEQFAALTIAESSGFNLKLR
jgi:hypothetical protein